MTYSIDFRKKVLKIKDKEGLSFSEAAQRFGISRAAIFRWSKNLKSHHTRNKPWKKLSKEALKKDIEQFPDSYSRERAERLGISGSGIKYAMRRLGISYKKNSKPSKGGSRKKIYVLPEN